jgi:hypothetical protein
MAHLLQFTPDKSLEIISAAAAEISAIESTMPMP